MKNIKNRSFIKIKNEQKVINNTQIKQKQQKMKMNKNYKKIHK